MISRHFPALDELDKKIRDHFRNRVVRKSYATSVPVLKKLPRYISEFIVNQHSDENGFLRKDVLEEIVNDLKKFFPEKKDKELYKSRALELGTVDLIGHFEVNTDLRQGSYKTYIKSIDEKASVNKDLILPTKYPDLLRGGLWGKATFEYLRRGDGGMMNMIDFESYQEQKPTLKRYIMKRNQFTTTEWLDMLIKTLGLEPASFTREKKLLYLTRLIPLVEPCTNTLEMGPPGTGKSHTYENLSFYSRSILGGDITMARFIYNQSTRHNGVIFNYDMICFDEINKPKSNLTTLIPKLQQIMASNRVERGELDAQTDVSLVFQGNIDFIKGPSGNPKPKYVDHFKDIPKGMKDPAFLDRIHGYIQGWDLPAVADNHLNHKLGLISNYFGEILHKLRGEDFTNFIDSTVSFFKLDPSGSKKAISLRDSISVKHLISGFLKLLHPHKKLTRDEWNEITTIAITLRQNVLDRIKRIDDNFNRKIDFSFISDELQGMDAAEQVSSPGMPKGGTSATSKVPLSTKASALPATESGSEPEDESEDGTLETMGIPLQLVLDADNYIAAKIPYWYLKILAEKGMLRKQKGGLKVAETFSSLNIPYAKTRRDRLSPSVHGESLDTHLEEALLEEIQKTVKDLKEKSSECIDLINDIQQMKFNIDSDSSSEEISWIQLIETEIKSLLSAISCKRYIDLKRESVEFEKIHETITMSMALTPNLLEFEKLDIVVDSQQVKSHLEDKIEAYQALESAASIKQKTLKSRIPLKESRDKKKEKVFFKGEPFKLFVFDVHNFHNSMRDKFGNDPNYMLKLENVLAKKIKDLVLPQGGNYLAFFFASKAPEYEKYPTFFPKGKNFRWFFEDMVKKKEDGKIKFSDVDALLSNKVSAFLALYKDQIEHLTFCSGDKDFHSIIEDAKAYDIPVTLCAVAREFLARDLHRIERDVILLFS
ncbi:BREX system Lon protease-like protein BrxL [Candidatus Bathyarchaeota archaeon]|nr:BREX system Lon protease-like protein BrxL [Candidatus Bathyarchaeota archaeon]